MSVERIHQLRAYPNFKLHELPQDERDEAGAIKANIGNMHRRATSFWAARVLFQNCAERQFLDPANRRTYYEWQLCAGRDAVMSIYHFGRITEGIDQSLSHCPTLRGLIDARAKSAARKKFERQFPAFIALRNAISHSAERSKTAMASRRHGKVTSKTIRINPVFELRVGDDTSILLVDDSIYGTTFSSMWEGKLLQSEINDQSGAVLDEITDDYSAAFDPIIDPNPEPQPTITFPSEPTPGLG